MNENALYYGDNLDILRRYIKDETVDLVYLDPPFNSQQNYNVLFAERNGNASSAQIRAFEDTWRWDQSAAEAYDELVTAADRVALVIKSLRDFLGGSDMMAYLCMMALRLKELHRVLKPTGSIYLHCDPTASHYLKIVMDAVFDPTNFRSEIIWKRTSGHSDANRFGSVHDTILFFARTPAATWNETYQPYDDEYVNQYYRYTDDSGRRFMSGDLGAAGLQGGGYEYVWQGVKRVWRCPQETMQRYADEGRLFYTRNGIPRLKRYLDESKGLPMQDTWTNIEALRSWHQERLGYPTQKPLALLERIISASSNEGDIVLDPFCGCGTTVAAAQKLNRRWIGIDVTHLAITLMKHRLKDSFGDAAKYEVIGEPVSLPDASVLAKEDPYQFQYWALGLVNARPVEQKKGADRGIDGRLYFQDVRGPSAKTQEIIFSVKAGHVTVSHVRDLRGVIEREGAAIGALLSLESPTQPMRSEAADAGFYESPWWPGKRFPRLQLLTIEDLLQGKTLEYPPSRAVDTTFKQAPKAKKKGAKSGKMFETRHEQGATDSE